MTKNKKQVVLDLKKHKEKIFTPIVYNQFMPNKSKFIVSYGGAGSGKSKGAAQKIVFRTSNEKNLGFLCVTKYAVNLKDTVFNEIKTVIHEWGLTPFYKIKISPLEITNILTGSKILFRGLDDEAKLKSIGGINQAWLEEADQMKQEDMEQILLRMRANCKTYKQMIITFNPTSQHSWLKRYFFDKALTDVTIIKSTYKDNPFLPIDYHNAMNQLKETNENFYRIYALGEWGVMNRLVFENYKIETFDEDTLDRFYYGLDFGYNDPTALIKVAYNKKTETIYIIDEFKESELTTNDLIPILEKKIDKNDYLICDSAEPDRIQEIKRAGFKKAKGAKKGKGSIQFSIDWIKAKKVVIHPRCKEFIKEIEAYEYKKDKKTDTYLDDPIDANNHLLDAMRYALNLEIKNKKKSIKGGKLRPF